MHDSDRQPSLNEWLTSSGFSEAAIKRVERLEQRLKSIRRPSLRLQAIVLIMVPLAFATVNSITLVRVIDSAATHTIPASAIAQCKGFIQLSILCNFALGGYLAVVFSRNMTRRLKIIADNIARLNARLPLNDPVEGDDEIAQLDAAVHRQQALLQLQKPGQI